MSAGQSTTRRTFLRTMAALFATGVAFPFPNQAGSAGAAQPGYKLAPWKGDDFTRGHQMRDGDAPPFPDKVERTVDFVIVGGGMAGLAAAYYLKDHNFLLLEQYEELGGQSRGGSYRGIDYSLGAAYLGTNDGLVGQLLSDLSLKPVEIPPTKNSWYWEGRWLPGVVGSDQSLIYKEFDRLKAESKAVWKSLPAWGSVPALDKPELSKLDSVSFGSYLKGYDPAFVNLIDKFCLSALCGGVEMVSALAGFYLAQDLFDPSYVLKGGNPALARALAKRLRADGSERCLTGTFVWNVSSRGGRAEVVYSTADGTMHRVACRQAIVTAPPLVAARIVSDLDDTAKALLFWPKYGSYLVANFCMPKKVFTGQYDNYVGSPFTFADMTVAETPYLATKEYKPEMGSVLTVYQPYPPSSAGRPLLLAGDREELASQLVAQLSKLVEHFQGNLEEVVLSRWGHAMVVAKPGFFAKLDKLAALDTTPFILAHNSMAGLPAAESAVIAARRAADRALGKKQKAGV